MSPLRFANLAFIKRLKTQVSLKSGGHNYRFATSGERDDAGAGQTGIFPRVNG